MLFIKIFSIIYLISLSLTEDVTVNYYNTNNGNCEGIIRTETITLDVCGGGPEGCTGSCVDFLEVDCGSSGNSVYYNPCYYGGWDRCPSSCEGWRRSIGNEGACNTVKTGEPRSWFYFPLFTTDGERTTNINQDLKVHCFLCSPACTGNSYCASENNCECFLGYTGTNCDNNNPNECIPACTQHATCVSNICQCNTGWVGEPECNTPANCDPICNSRATCTGTNTCTCKDGYSGPPECNTNGTASGKSEALLITGSVIIPLLCFVVFIIALVVTIVSVKKVMKEGDYKENLIDEIEMKENYPPKKEIILPPQMKIPQRGGNYRGGRNSRGIIRGRGRNSRGVFRGRGRNSRGIIRGRGRNSRGFNRGRGRNSRGDFRGRGRNLRGGFRGNRRNSNLGLYIPNFSETMKGK